MKRERGGWQRRNRKRIAAEEGGAWRIEALAKEKRMKAATRLLAAQAGVEVLRRSESEKAQSTNAKKAKGAKTATQKTAMAPGGAKALPHLLA